MAKKLLPAETVETKVEPAKEVAVVAKTGALLPSPEGASPELLERIKEVQDNLESIEQFRLPRAKMTASGIELVEGDAPILEMEGVILHTKKTNVYYDKPYNPSAKAEPPRCYAPDAEIPVVENPIHPTCKGCPMAEFGTNSMKSGKACRNLKPMYLLLSDEAIMPRQLTITPASLKAANQYLLDLAERGIAYRKVKTKVQLYKENPKDTYYKIKFSIAKKLDEQQIKNVEYLRNQWRPIMDAQLVDQKEFDSPQSAPVDAPNGEF
jgi:hypothetical protein